MSGTPPGFNGRYASAVAFPLRPEVLDLRSNPLLPLRRDPVPAGRPLGFRGLESFIIEGLASDLTVAEAVDGKPMLFTPSHTIAIPSHDLGDTIHVCAVLVGQRLTVDVDGQQVLDREFPVQVRAGGAGVHALAANLAAYDNVRINAVPVP